LNWKEINMKETSKVRLNVALRELNISLDRAVEFLSHKKIEIEGDQSIYDKKNKQLTIINNAKFTDKSKNRCSK